MNFADQEEIDERQKRRAQKKHKDVIWNSLTTIFVTASVAAIAYFLFLFVNPSTSLNPYPAPTRPALLQLATSTPTIVSLPATWTPAPISTATPEPTHAITETPASDVTSTPMVSSGQYIFAPKSEPVAMENTVFHPSMDCNWQGVAGQVWDIQGRPFTNLVVHLKGYYNGKNIDQTTLTGGAAGWIGESGYEFVLELGSAPIDTTGMLTIQLEDNSYIPISDKVTFNTYASCDKNLILINFQQVR